MLESPAVYLAALAAPLDVAAAVAVGAAVGAARVGTPSASGG